VTRRQETKEGRGWSGKVDSYIFGSAIHNGVALFLSYGSERPLFEVVVIPAMAGIMQRLQFKLSGSIPTRQYSFGLVMAKELGMETGASTGASRQGGTE
jgi:hypothetical protein